MELPKTLIEALRWMVEDEEQNGLEPGANLYETFDGDVDDAFWFGFDAGRAEVAKQVLAELEVKD